MSEKKKKRERNQEQGEKRSGGGWWWEAGMVKEQASISRAVPSFLSPKSSNHPGPYLQNKTVLSFVFQFTMEVRQSLLL